MGENSTTRQARRAVAELVAHYFRALKRHLAGQTAAFWERVEAAREARIPDDDGAEKKDVNKRVVD